MVIIRGVFLLIIKTIRPLRLPGLLVAGHTLTANRKKSLEHGVEADEADFQRVYDYSRKILVPETGEPVTTGALTREVERPDVNVIDAAARGAGEGLRLALVVGAMLIAFAILIATGGVNLIADAMIRWFPGFSGLG